METAQVCNVYLVSGEYGVPDGSLTASSSLATGHAPKYGRLNTSYVQGEHFGGWAPQVASNQYIQAIDISNVKRHNVREHQGICFQFMHVMHRLLEYPQQSRWICALQALIITVVPVVIEFYAMPSVAVYQTSPPLNIGSCLIDADTGIIFTATCVLGAGTGLWVANFLTTVNTAHPSV
ncbi:hypothetical protein CHS0354_029478 [Potamilus streckersoni]|uniref:Uncharacterized protein n=1 Tax=Potamilus streckersoni TaxID=2493646 RepID=A0AAE0S774_9BIVA|nr:hypothetical protein CHS0354_029478 [Potamilus streckersoni]